MGRHVISLAVTPYFIVVTFYHMIRQDWKPLLVSVGVSGSINSLVLTLSIDSESSHVSFK